MEWNAKRQTKYLGDGEKIARLRHCFLGDVVVVVVGSDNRAINLGPLTTVLPFLSTRLQLNEPYSFHMLPTCHIVNVQREN